MNINVLFYLLYYYVRAGLNIFQTNLIYVLQSWVRVQQIMEEFSNLIKDAESLDNGEFRFKDEL